MKTVGISEAKTHFSDIIDRVVDGETIVVTRHGTPVARIVPEPPDRARLHKMIDDWLEYRKAKGITLGDVSIRELIEEGRM
jgi:prevent-host-death family protein